MRRLAAAIALAVSTLPAPAHGQIVNVLYDAPPDAEAGFGGRLTASGKWVSGNVDQVELDASASLRYRFDRHLWLLFGNGGFGELNGASVKNKATGHLRYRVDLVGPLQWEAYVQGDRNEFRRRLSRAVFGTGPRLEVLEGPAVWLALGASYMPEFERLSEGDFTDSELTRWHHRVSFYLSHVARPTERFRLLFTAYLQPAFDAIDNLRAFSDLSLQFDIVEGLSIMASHSLQLDTLPPDTVRPVDADRRLTLAYRW